MFEDSPPDKKADSSLLVPLGEELLLIGERNQSKEKVPTVFKWTGGGTEVFVTGTFNEWKGKFALTQQFDNTHDEVLFDEDGNVATQQNNSNKKKEFSLVMDILPGIYQYKFIVDGEWQLNEDSPSILTQGVVNNIVEVKAAVFEDTRNVFVDSDSEEQQILAHQRNNSGAANGSGAGGGGGGGNAASAAITNNGSGASSGDGQPGAAARRAAAVEASEAKHAGSGGKLAPARFYGHVVPPADSYNVDPPRMPPHLTHVLLNAPSEERDAEVLPAPCHVSLNHLFTHRPAPATASSSSSNDNVVVTAIAQRFKTKSHVSLTPKFVSTVYYAPKPPPASSASASSDA
jgi:hypothetical protein